MDDDVEPDLRLGDIALWTLRRRAAPTPDLWWVDEIVCRVDIRGGIVGELNGEIPSRNFASFLVDLERCYESLAGRAQLDGSDMGLILTFEAGSLGHFRVETQVLWVGNWTGSLTAGDDVDQSFLPPLIMACRRILERFPVRATRDLL